MPRPAYESFEVGEGSSRGFRAPNFSGPGGQTNLRLVEKSKLVIDEARLSLEIEARQLYFIRKV